MLSIRASCQSDRLSKQPDLPSEISEKKEGHYATVDPHCHRCSVGALCTLSDCELDEIGVK